MRYDTPMAYDDVLAAASHRTPSARASRCAGTGMGTHFVGKTPDLEIAHEKQAHGRDEEVRFELSGEPGVRCPIAGTFNNWDRRANR